MSLYFHPIHPIPGSTHPSIGGLLQSVHVLILRHAEHLKHVAGGAAVCDEGTFEVLSQRVAFWHRGYKGNPEAN